MNSLDIKGTQIASDKLKKKNESTDDLYLTKKKKKKTYLMDIIKTYILDI